MSLFQAFPFLYYPRPSCPTCSMSLYLFPPFIPANAALAYVLIAVNDHYMLWIINQCIISCKPSNSLESDDSIIPILQTKAESLSNLPKITQLGCPSAGTWTRIVWHQKWSFETLGSPLLEKLITLLPACLILALLLIVYISAMDHLWWYGLMSQPTKPLMHLMPSTYFLISHHSFL